MLPSREIPRTPEAVRPITLISSSLNLTILPLSLPKSTKSFPVVFLTSINLSFSLREIQILPLFLILANSLINVFFTTPPSVANNKYLHSSSRLIWITALTLSSFST